MKMLNGQSTLEKQGFSKDFEVAGVRSPNWYLLLEKTKQNKKKTYSLASIPTDDYETR